MAEIRDKISPVKTLSHSGHVVCGRCVSSCLLARIYTVLHMLCSGPVPPSVIRPCNIQNYSDVRRAWCRRKDRDEYDTLVITGYRLSSYLNRVRTERSTVLDDTQKGMITVTMQELQVQDSVLCWCPHYAHSHFFFSE